MQKLRIIALAAAMAACSSNDNTGPGTTNPPPPATTLQAQGTFDAVSGKAFQYPARVATGADGTVYVSDNAASEVVAVKDGAPLFRIKNLAQPLGVAVSGNYLYVGSVGRHTVEIYDLAAKKGIGAVGGFEMPNSIAVAADGAVYVVDSKKDQVTILTAKGSSSFGSHGTTNGQFWFPVGIAVDASRVIVGDQNNHRVQIFDRSGNFVLAFGSEIQNGKTIEDYKNHFTGIGSVAIGPNGIYVLDSVHAYVQVFDDLGASKGFFGNVGTCPTCVKLALDIAVDGAGHVFATDPENRRVVSLSTEMR